MGLACSRAASSGDEALRAACLSDGGEGHGAPAPVHEVHEVHEEQADAALAPPMQQELGSEELLSLAAPVTNAQAIQLLKQNPFPINAAAAGEAVETMNLLRMGAYVGAIGLGVVAMIGVALYASHEPAADQPHADSDGNKGDEPPKLALAASPSSPHGPGKNGNAGDSPTGSAEPQALLSPEPQTPGTTSSKWIRTAIATGLTGAEIVRGDGCPWTNPEEWWRHLPKPSEDITRAQPASIDRSALPAPY